MYTVGETEKAIRLFLGLLRGSQASSSPYDANLNDFHLQSEAERDKAFLEDFRLAFEVTIKCSSAVFLLLSYFACHAASPCHQWNRSNPK